MSDSDGLFPVAELEHVDPVVGDGVEAGSGVNKRFRAFEPAAVMLVPPSLDEWLPQNHLSRFIAGIAETQLDLEKFTPPTRSRRASGRMTHGWWSVSCCMGIASGFAHRGS